MGKVRGTPTNQTNCNHGGGVGWGGKGGKEGGKGEGARGQGNQPNHQPPHQARGQGKGARRQAGKARSVQPRLAINQRTERTQNCTQPESTEPTKNCPKKATRGQVEGRTLGKGSWEGGRGQARLGRGLGRGKKGREGRAWVAVNKGQRRLLLWKAVGQAAYYRLWEGSWKRWEGCRGLLPVGRLWGKVGRR